MQKTGNEPQIIILNGASSSGKTSIAKALQKLLKAPFNIISSDGIIDEIPKCLNKGTFVNEIHRRLNDQVKTAAKNGEHFIIDIAFGKEGINELYADLSEFNYCSIALRASLEVLEKRERERQQHDERPIGLAKRQFDIHNGIKYHLTIDNSALTAEQAASKIRNNFPQDQATTKPTLQCKMV